MQSLLSILHYNRLNQRKTKREYEYIAYLVGSSVTSDIWREDMQFPVLLLYFIQLEQKWNA